MVFSNGWILGIALFFVVLVIIGLTAWLVWIMTRGDEGGQRETPSAQGGSNRRSRAVADEIITVRLNDRGIWEVLIYGKRYDSLGQVPDEALREQVVNGVRILAAFSRDYIQRKRRAVSPDDEEPSGKIPPFVSTEKEPQPQLRQGASAPSLMPQIDLAKEIGEILAVMQAREPDLAARSIRVQNAPGGGVFVAVDGVTYESVDDIPDADVRQLLRRATQEWERR
jgi:hypothetical protein